jgi:hypothetical protein
MGEAEATDCQGEIVQVDYRDRRGVEYDAVPLPTHEVTVRADLPTKPKRRPMTAAARAAFGKRMKASREKREEAQG